MKKSIVLLISLFFISSLSILILQNLNDTQNYIFKQNSKLSKIQAITLINNTQKELEKFLKTYNDANLEEIVKKTFKNYIPFQLEDIQVLFKLNNYEKENINDLKVTNKKDEFIRYLNDNGIFDISILSEEIKQRDIKNSKQLNKIIENFAKKSYNLDEKVLKEKIGFFETEENEKYFELYVKINYLSDFVAAYYILTKKGVPRYFEINFN